MNFFPNKYWVGQILDSNPCSHLKNLNEEAILSVINNQLFNRLLHVINQLYHAELVKLLKLTNSSM